MDIKIEKVSRELAVRKALPKLRTLKNSAVFSKHGAGVNGAINTVLIPPAQSGDLLKTTMTGAN